VGNAEERVGKTSNVETLQIHDHFSQQINYKGKWEGRREVAVRPITWKDLADASRNHSCRSLIFIGVQTN
jgi:hypothetical protein